MTRPLLWSTKAKSDFVDIIRYLSAENGSAAVMVRDRIERAVLSLTEIPTGRPGRVAGVYEKSVAGAPYVVAYQIETRPSGEERVMIVRIIHQSRNWPQKGWPRD